MGLLSGLLGGGTKNQTTTTKVEPWAPQGEMYQELFQDVNAIKDKPMTYFQGPGYVDKSAGTQAGMDYMTGYAQNQAQNMFGQSTGQMPYMLNAYDINANPYAQDWMAAAINPLYDRLTEQVMPEIRSGARMAGQQGSTRQGVAEALAARETARAAGETNARMAGEMYQQGLDASLKTMQMTPELMTAGLIPGTAMYDVGARDEAYAAAKLMDEMQRWNFEQMEPWQRLAMTQGLISGNLGGTTTATAPVQTPGLLQKALGGIMGGAGLSSAFGEMGMGAAAGPLGWGLGALMALG